METAWTPERLRAFEESVKKLFLDGKIRAPIHLSGGNEERLIEIFKQVQPGDWVFSTHRSHFHALLKGIPGDWVSREILEGRSIHLNNAEHRFFTSAIVGGCLPIALGVAMAIKRNSQGRRVWCFIGDMAFETGVASECIKYARGFELPLCVVVEDNGLSTNTPTREVWGIPQELPLLDQGGVIELCNWGQGKVVYYPYQRVYPHINVGSFVVFS